MRRAARLADGFFSNAAPGRFAEQVQVANAEMERIGRDPAGFSWTYYQHVYPAADPEAGWAELRPHLWALRWKYGDFGASAARSGPLPAPPPVDSTTESGLRESALIGPAEHVAAEVTALRERVGVPFEFVARSYFQTMPFNQQSELLERLATEVGPLLD